LKAYGQWHDIRYLNQAKIIINDIWGKEIVNVAGHYYVASSAAGQNSAGNLLINPSYIAPSYYKAFAKIDPSHPWNALVNDSYAFLSNLQNKTTGLVPDWTEINSEGNVIPLDITGLSNDSGYDAFRSGFRVSQDSTDFRSKEYLKPLLNFYSAEWNQNHIIKAVYELNGIPKVTYGDIAQYSAIAAILKAGGQQKVATEIMTQKIDSSYKNGSWGDPKNYYNQNWAALGLQQYIKK
jgi:endo-1,4-beta-D-glucanase Y